MARKSDLCLVEKAKPWGPNVISWEMQVGKEKEERWYCVDCYLQPPDKVGMGQRLLPRLMQVQPNGIRLLVLENLNVNLNVPRTTQEDVLVVEVTELGLFCPTRHYMSRTTGHVRGRWTFRRPTYTPEGERQWMRDKPDYTLVQKEDRGKLQN